MNPFPVTYQRELSPVDVFRQKMSEMLFASKSLRRKRAGSAVMGMTCCDCAVQPPEPVARTVSVTEPEAPAVKEIVWRVGDEVIDPLEIDQLKEMAPVAVTLAELSVELGATL